MLTGPPPKFNGTRDILSLQLRRDCGLLEHPDGQGVQGIQGGPAGMTGCGTPIAPLQNCAH